jgi:hypothetical protein
MAALTKEFVTAGRAVFTLEVPPTFKMKDTVVKPHYTYRVNFKKGTGQYKDAYFVQLLTGPDNTKSYSYLGMLDAAEGSVRTTAKSCRADNDLSVVLLRRALLRVWASEVHIIEKSGFKLHHEGRCGRCGRALTTPESVERGIGPECWTQMSGGNYPHLVAQQELDAKAQKRLDDEELERAISESEGASAWPEDYDPNEDYEPDPADEAETQALQRAYNPYYNPNRGW